VQRGDRWHHVKGNWHRDPRWRHGNDRGRGAGAIAELREAAAPRAAIAALFLLRR